MINNASFLVLSPAKGIKINDFSAKPERIYPNLTCGPDQCPSAPYHTLFSISVITIYLLPLS
jgi:hypothetical protein